MTSRQTLVKSEHDGEKKNVQKSFLNKNFLNFKIVNKISQILNGF